MKRLIFVNRYFFPDHSATSQILSDLAFHLAESGQDVHVITSRQIYDKPEVRLPRSEVVKRVHIHRISSTHFGRSSLLGRAVDYMSFYVSVRRYLLALAKSGDIIIAKTDPPLMSVVAMGAARRTRSHLVNWLQDIYPEVATELNVPFIKGRLAGVLSSWRDRSLRAAQTNVVLGLDMAKRIRSRGVSSERIHVIPNWTDDEEITAIAPADNPLRRSWELEDKFVVGYSGNFGRGHEFDTILAASERLRDHPHIMFLFIGGGQRLDELAQRVKQKSLGRTYRFLPYQQRIQLKYSLSVPDVHWISLRPGLDELMFPSKFYGIAAAGRPLIAIANKNGELASLVRQYRCGLVIEPGDAEGLAEALVALSQDRPRGQAMGQNARAMLESNFTRRQALERWTTLLRKIQ